DALPIFRTLNLLNRRIRVRTYGGVRGAEGQLAFPSTRFLCQYCLFSKANKIKKHPYRVQL
ncbi:hypothetical protein, partial [Enterococcus faecium]|uniref:hypothetical protein n=1 Tax=Enterococcus faecium TaxID=1352 RepID=UPI00292DA8E5